MVVRHANHYTKERRSHSLFTFLYLALPPLHCSFHCVLSSRSIIARWSCTNCTRDCTTMPTTLPLTTNRIIAIKQFQARWPSSVGSLNSNPDCRYPLRSPGVFHSQDSFPSTFRPWLYETSSGVVVAEARRIIVYEGQSCHTANCTLVYNGQHHFKTLPLFSKHEKYYKKRQGG